MLTTLVLDFLPSLFKGFLTTYWWTSSVERVENFQILLTLVGPTFWGTVAPASPGLSFSLFVFPTITELRTFRLTSTIQPLIDSHFSLTLFGLERECPLLTSTLQRVKMSCFMKNLVSGPHNPSTLHPEHQQLLLLMGSMTFVGIVPFREFLTAGGWKKTFIFILMQLMPRRSHEKELNFILFLVNCFS